MGQEKKRVLFPLPIIQRTTGEKFWRRLKQIAIDAFENLLASRFFQTIHFCCLYQRLGDKAVIL